MLTELELSLLTFVNLEKDQRMGLPIGETEWEHARQGAFETLCDLNRYRQFSAVRRHLISRSGAGDPAVQVILGLAKTVNDFVGLSDQIRTLGAADVADAIQERKERFWRLPETGHDGRQAPNRPITVPGLSSEEETPDPTVAPVPDVA